MKTQKAKYTLYEAQRTTLRLSNDAFMYFIYGEEPLDDDCQFEIEGVKSKYPYGFEPDYDSIVYPKDAVGKVEVMVVPYTIKTFICDNYMNLGPYIYLCVDFISAESVHFWWFIKGRIVEEGDRPIEFDEDTGRKFFCTKPKARVYLDGLKKFSEKGDKN